MKFNFCSDGDCPLWVLAGLHALSTLPAQLFRSLVQCIIDGQNDDDTMEILKDTSLSSREESARAAATIRWVLHQAHSSSTTSSQLQKDLLLLAVPRSHATIISEAADQTREAYNETAINNGIIINRVTDATVADGPEGSVGVVTLKMQVDDVITGQCESHETLLDRAQAKELLGQLKMALEKMKELEVKQKR